MLCEKRILSLIVVILMLATLIPKVSFADSTDGYWTDPGNYSTDWYTNNSDSDTYEISTAQELAGFAVLANGLNGESKVSFGKKTITLTSDIDLSSHLWRPIEITDYNTLTFNGGNVNITGLKCNNDGNIGNYAGLFGTVQKLVISNLNFVNVDIDMTNNASELSYAGAIVGYADSVDITNCRVVDSDIDCIGYAGGLVGYIGRHLSADSAYNSANVTGFRTGGIAGMIDGMPQIFKCFNMGNISTEYSNPESSDDTPTAGGILGECIGDTVMMTLCANYGNVEALSNGYMCIAGGIVGDFNYPENKLDNSACDLVNTGSVSSNGIAGGLFGTYNIGTMLFLDFSYNTGKVTGVDYAGGLIGTYYNNANAYGYYTPEGQGYCIAACYSTGNVIASKTGGLIGKGECTARVAPTADDNGNWGVLLKCYYLDGTADNSIGESVGISDLNYKDESTAVTSDDVESGMLTVNMNSTDYGKDYGQNIDNKYAKDSQPLLKDLEEDSVHELVYKSVVNTCDGVSKTTYSNTAPSYEEITKDHEITCTAKDNVLTATCSVCKKTGTATLDLDSSINADEYVYTGEEQPEMEVIYSDGWKDLGLDDELIISTDLNIYDDTYTTSIYSGGATAYKIFTVDSSSAVDYGEDGDPNAEMVTVVPGTLLVFGYTLTKDKESVHKGGSITITMTPWQNFNLDLVYANGELIQLDENNQYKFTNMQEDIYITTGTTSEVGVTYNPAQYACAMTVPEDAEGYGISIDREYAVEGQPVVVTFNVLDGYEKTSDFKVYANDKLIQLDENNQYTIDPVTEDVTFRAEGIVKKDVAKSFKRYYGANRYDTSLEAAGAVKENLGVEKFDNVIITSGENFADALSGAYLAKLRNAPILGVNSATEARIQTYINKNLKADGTVYILGGTGAVSQKMENALAKDGYTIKRLGGATRYDTNLEILKECEVSGADILVCSGTGYADSLSASAAGRPIMLVANEFSKDQQAYLGGITTGTMYIVGGVGAVNEGVEKAAASYGTTKRLGGATRYDTSVLVAEEFFSGNCDNLVLAYGQNFPDGLSGGPLALTLDAPLILTMNNDTVSQKAADFAAKKNVKFIAVLGGAPLISDATVQKILN